MEPRDYVVLRFEGDYAYLKRTDAPAEGELYIARALLPDGTEEGDSLHYELFEYSLIRD